MSGAADGLVLDALFDATHPSRVPAHVREALDRWGTGEHPYTGDFLRAVLSNDLTEAVGRADQHNLRVLPAIVTYCYNHLPSPSWGSPERVAAWQAQHVAAIEAKRDAASAGGAS